MNKQDILVIFSKAKDLAKLEIKKTDDAMVKAALDALVKNERKVLEAWPLKEEDRKTYMGLHAVRNLLPDFKVLADYLMELDYRIENPEVNEMPTL